MNKQINPKLFIAFLCFIFFIKTSAESFNNKPDYLKDSVKFSIQYFKEIGIELEKDILTKKFKPLPESNSLGIKNGIYWFKLEVNKSSKNLIAFIPTHNIDKIDVYQLIGNKLKYISSTGNSISSNEIPIQYKFPAFKITTSTSRESILYLKVDFPKEANFPLRIIKEDKFIPYIMNKKTINSFYYGTCIVIIFLNFFFYIKFKDKNYLFYLLFLSSLMILFLIFDGSLIAIFRGNSFYYYLEYLVHISCEVWFILFSIKFLNLDKKHSSYINLFFLFPIIITVLYLIYSITNRYLFAALGDVIGVILLPVLWFYGIYYIKQIPYAKFYVFGYLLLIPFAVYFILGFPFGLWKVNGEMLIIKIASWLDMIVFTYALIIKMKNQSEENKKIILLLQNTIQNSKRGITVQESTIATDPYLSLLKENDFSSSRITLRELDIIKTICEGLTSIEISKKLFISNNTVKYHIRNIYTKINVSTRNELQEKISSYIKKLNT